MRCALFTLPFVALVALSGCNQEEPGLSKDGALDGPATRDGTSADKAAGGDLAAGTISDTGPLYLDSCKQFASACATSKDPECGKCGYRIRHHTGACTRSKPCDDLLLIWAHAGCQGQRMGTVMGDAVTQNPDLVVACAQPIHPGEVLPTTLGAPERENALMPYLLGRLRSGGGTGVWSGKNMLMGGCSMGATRYPVVAARYADHAKWLGSTKNAACMSDGVVSVIYQDQFIGEDLTGSSCPGRHRRMVVAYTRSTSTGVHACKNSPKGQCACDPAHTFIKYPGDCGGGDCVSFDSIMIPKASGFVFNSGVSAASFAVKKWKLVTEGDSFRSTSNRCDKDVVPRGPFKAFCEALDAGSKHSCTFVGRANDPHCGYYWTNISSLCVEWFKKL